jgi:lactoylglutathione lyase
VDTPIEDLGLGCFQLCLLVSSLEASSRFYADLGFEVKEGGQDQGFIVLRREDCEVGLFTENIEAPVLNFRGGNTTAIARRLTELGLELNMNRTNEDGSGSVMVKDPDGNILFFDSSPAEIQAYEQNRQLYKQLS